MRTRLPPEYEKALLWYTIRSHTFYRDNGVYDIDLFSSKPEWREIIGNCSDHPITVLGDLLQRYGTREKECMGISINGLEYLRYYELVQLEELLFCPNIITRHVVTKYFNER